MPDQAEAAGEHHRPVEALHDAGNDQHERVMRERVEQRGARQHQRPGKKRPAPPVIVANRSAAQHSGGRTEVPKVERQARHPGLRPGWPASSAEW
jgi:hypothetical protein